MDWMEDLLQRIQRLRDQIEADCQALNRLEAEWRQFLEQEKERKHYFSSKEILELIREHSGQEKNMTAIKRWADEGLLGEKIEEKERFPLLVHKQGNKRYLYPKPAVLQFLVRKQFIRPRFDILDQVVLTHFRPDQVGVVIASHLAQDWFVYTVQLEHNGEIMRDIAEANLLLVEEES